MSKTNFKFPNNTFFNLIRQKEIICHILQINNKAFEELTMSGKVNIVIKTIIEITILPSEMIQVIKNNESCLILFI